jgi:hypothetical protein
MERFGLKPSLYTRPGVDGDTQLISVLNLSVILEISFSETTLSLFSHYYHPCFPEGRCDPSLAFGPAPGDVWGARDHCSYLPRYLLKRVFTP